METRAVGRGDGEDAMVEILEGRDFEDIAGLSCRVDGQVTHNPARTVNMNLDDYPILLAFILQFFFQLYEGKQKILTSSNF